MNPSVTPASPQRRVAAPRLVLFFERQRETVDDAPHDLQQLTWGGGALGRAMDVIIVMI